MLNDACALIATRASAKLVKIEAEINEEISYVGDEAFLRQLFLIFMENAIKYSPPSTCLRVRLFEERGSVQIQFQDQGVGISKRDQPRIYERFYRVLQPTSGEAQSGGLGLAIAQAIAGAHNGSIRCESTLGVGTTFTILLPSLLPATSSSPVLQTSQSRI